jgi:hypothetical protein
MCCCHAAGHGWQWNDAKKDPAWFHMMLKASESGIIAPSELTDLRLEMGEDQYQQEFECSFEAAIKGLSSETKCNTPADLIIGTADQDLRECCHAMLFAFVVPKRCARCWPKVASVRSRSIRMLRRTLHGTLGLVTRRRSG